MGNTMCLDVWLAVFYIAGLLTGIMMTLLFLRRVVYNRGISRGIDIHQNVMNRVMVKRRLKAVTSPKDRGV